jgi:hypothetical protein
MTLKQPSLFFRAMILGAQGVFFNAFCAYPRFSAFVLSRGTKWTIYSPRICHLAADLPPLRRPPRRVRRIHVHARDRRARKRPHPRMVRLPFSLPLTCS